MIRGFGVSAKTQKEGVLRASGLVNHVQKGPGTLAHPTLCISTSGRSFRSFNSLCIRPAIYEVNLSSKFWELLQQINRTRGGGHGNQLIAGESEAQETTWIGV